MSFGCAVDNYGQTIMVCGGQLGGGLGEFTDSCELYSIENNQWTPLPKMNEKRSSPSLCMFNESSLFVFGGYDPMF